MKKILTDNIVANLRGQRFSSASLTHLMSAYEEGLQAILSALHCDPAEITILSGAVVTEDGQDYEVSAGWAAYQGEIFQIDVNAFTAPGGEVAVWVIEETYLASDPVKFDDGNEFNVNQIRKLKLQSGVAGSGLKDWNDVDTPNAWRTTEYLNGWKQSLAAVYASSAKLRFIKKAGVVILKGRLEGSEATSNPAFILPEGFRPDQDIADINQTWVLRTTGEMDFVGGTFDPNAESLYIDTSFPAI